MSQITWKKYNKVTCCDEDFIKCLIQNQDQAICKIYKTLFNSIKKMVYTFKNTKLEPEDIFQEGLTRAIMNIRAGKFNGDSSFATYLNSICRNICLKELSRNKVVLLSEVPASKELSEDNYYELLGFINQIKNKLGIICQEILDLRFKQDDNKIPESEPDNKLREFEVIAEQLNITSTNARQRFKRCLEQLREMVFEHPDHKTLFD